MGERGISMVRTQIQLKEEQADILKKIAIEQNTSVAEIIRRAVDDVIKSARLPDHEESRKRAIEIAGKFRSGKHDISARHDRYLEEAYKE
jgi:hypothetical protein